MKAKKTLSLLLCLLMVLAISLPAFSASEGAETGYKNIIIMIGDGMGENHLKLAEEYGHTLFMNTQYDLRGQSRTRSASHFATDSAAGGTALSSGKRIINQTVGVYAYDPFALFDVPKSITEVAQERGMKTGIVTTDNTTGATPASFSVHHIYRKDYDKLAEKELKTNLDLFWGMKDENTTITREDVEANGWTYIGNKAEMDALEPGSKSFGQFRSFWHTYVSDYLLPKEEDVVEDVENPDVELVDEPEEPAEDLVPPLLNEASVKAIELLNADNDNGFFLMIEGAHIDKQSHKDDGIKMDYDKKREEVVDAVVAFDNAIRDVVDFARRDGHTVVLVTADHETGWLFKDRGRYRFHSNEHTAANVPVFVFCADSLFKPGQAVMNCSIPIRLTRLCGWGKDEFPAKRDGEWKIKMKSIFNLAA